MTLPNSFTHAECDIPVGVTLDEWRRVNRPAPRPSLFRRTTRRDAR